MLIRPREIRKWLLLLKGDKSFGEFASLIGCNRSNLFDALKGRRAIPNAAAEKLGYRRVVAYAPIKKAYPPLDNKD